MGEMSEYVNATAALGGSVHDVSRKLIKYSEDLRDLTDRLRSLFELFSRGDELLRIVRDYSRNSQSDIDRLKDSLHVYEDTVSLANDHFTQVQTRLESILGLINDIQTNAGDFIEAARSLAHIAKNTEIKAYHAKREGKGLAIIAKECLALAKLAQLPFTDFSTMLQDLREAAEPLVRELERIIKLSEHSRSLLDKSFQSLSTINQATLSLQQIVNRAEQNSTVYQRMKQDTTRELAVLSGQITISLGTVDDISARCAQLVSLSELLDNVDSLYHTIGERGQGKGNGFNALMTTRLSKQCHCFYDENVRVLHQLSLAKAPPLFPQEALQDIQNIAQQISTIGSSFADFAMHRERLGTGLTEIIQLVQGIQEFLEETDTIFQHLHSLGNDLHEKIEKTERLVAETNKISMRIKTLSVYAKIEEGRSSFYQRLLSSIIADFIELEKRTEHAFIQIAPKLGELKKNAHFLQRMKSGKGSMTVTYPDYSKIKLFLDDIIRVFREEEDKVARVVNVAEHLITENAELTAVWQKYKDGINQLSKIIASPRTYHEPSQPMIALPRTEYSLRTSLADDPMTLKPDLRTDLTSHKVINNFSSGLFQFGAGVDIVPGLCEDYAISNDGTTYTFTLRENLKYQNGRRLGIGDFRNSFTKALQGPNANFFEMIVGARDIIGGSTTHLAGVRVINNRQLECRLEYPFLPFLANLAANIADPYIDTALPIGMGPFQIVSWDEGRQIRLHANEYFYAGRPNIDHLLISIIPDEMTAYEMFCANELDIYQAADTVIDLLKRDSSVTLYTVPELSIQYLGINCQAAPFDNVHVRKAIAHAIDRERLVKNLLPNNAVAAKGVFPPSMKVYNRILQGYEYSPRQAKECLTAAGYESGLPDCYPLDVNNTPSAIGRAEFVKKNLEAIGIRIDINPLPGHTLMEKRYSGKSMLSFSGWISDNGDPDNFLYPLFHSSSYGRPGNTSFFSLPEIDQAIDDARKTRNFEQRLMLYRQIEKKILEQSPVVFLYHRVLTLAVKKGILGIKPHPFSLIRAQHAFSAQKHFDLSDAQKENGHGTREAPPQVALAAR